MSVHFPRTSQAKVVTYYDSLVNSTYVPRLSPVRNNEDNLRQTLTRDRSLDVVKYDDATSTGNELNKFFQRSYVSPPKKM